MMVATNMSPPATRGEPTAELETFEQRLDGKYDERGAAWLAALQASEQRLLAGFERIFQEARPADRRIAPDPEQGR